MVGFRAELLELIGNGGVRQKEKLTKTDRGQFLAVGGPSGGLMGISLEGASGLDDRRNEREGNRGGARPVTAGVLLA